MMISVIITRLIAYDDSVSPHSIAAYYEWCVRRYIFSLDYKWRKSRRLLLSVFESEVCAIENPRTFNFKIFREYGEMIKLQIFVLFLTSFFVEILTEREIQKY